MTQKEKQLLIKDLCERLPHGVIINCIDPHFSGSTDEKLYSVNWLEQTVMSGEWNNEYKINNIKPYLHPMSSMTEEEKREYFDITQVSNHCAAIDWLNAHHFDYRGLIEMGLALEAPEGMYNFKTE